MSLENYLTCLLAAIALAVVPGPTVTVIIANSMRYGQRAGLLNMVGTQLGVMVWLAIAALGLQAAIAVMGIWFDILRFAGAAYLMWLGLKMFRSNGNIAALSDNEPANQNLLLQGFTVIMANPKMLVLFGALIPPFLSRDGNSLYETVLLGVSFSVVAAITDGFYAIAAARAGLWLSTSRIRIIEVISGVCLVVGGAWMALRSN